MTESKLPVVTVMVPVKNEVRYIEQTLRQLYQQTYPKDRLEVIVADSGPGIKKEDIPKLFNKFQQVGERSATDISGTGLGLAISKEIIDLHHGRIWADPEVEDGASFVFMLPISQESSEA